MKKSLIIIIAVIILVIIGGGIGIILNNLNRDKTSITATSFKNHMEDKGYILTDANSQFEEYDYIKQVYIAVSNDYGFQIEFYELTDDSYAMNFYNNNKSIFESSKGSDATQTKVGLKNYSKYTLSSNEKYSVVSRIDNTVIYVNVDENYKDTVKDILDELGY